MRGRANATTRWTPEPDAERARRAPGTHSGRSESQTRSKLQTAVSPSSDGAHVGPAVAFAQVTAPPSNPLCPTPLRQPPPAVSVSTPYPQDLFRFRLAGSFLLARPFAWALWGGICAGVRVLFRALGRLTLRYFGSRGDPWTLRVSLYMMPSAVSPAAMGSTAASAFSSGVRSCAAGVALFGGSLNAMMGRARAGRTQLRAAATTEGGEAGGEVHPLCRKVCQFKSGHAQSRRCRTKGAHARICYGPDVLRYRDCWPCVRGATRAGGRALQKCAPPPRCPSVTAMSSSDPALRWRRILCVGPVGSSSRWSRVLTTVAFWRLCSTRRGWLSSSQLAGSAAPSAGWPLPALTARWPRR